MSAAAAATVWLNMEDFGPGDRGLQDRQSSWTTPRARRVASMSWKTSAGVRCLPVNPNFHHSATAAPATAIARAVQPTSNGPFAPRRLIAIARRTTNTAPAPLTRSRTSQRGHVVAGATDCLGNASASLRWLRSRPPGGRRPQERREEPAGQAARNTPPNLAQGDMPSLRRMESRLKRMSIAIEPVADPLWAAD